MVALYETGQVIYVRKDRGKYVYYSCMLDGARLAEFKRDIAAAVGLNALKPYYSLAPNVTDQPIAEYYMDAGEVSKATEIYAFPADQRLAVYTVMPGETKPDVIPAQLTTLDSYLRNIDSPLCISWNPQYIEVVAWPAGDKYASQIAAPVSWPADWPGTNSDHAIAHSHDGMYSIYLDSKELPKLKKLLAPIRKGGAMMFEGKKWFLTYRPVLPGEPIWREAFEKIEEQQQ